MMPQHLCFTAFSAEEIADKFRENTRINPTLGIIFSSVSLDIPTLANPASSFNIPIFGCSTAGEILTVDEEPPMHEQSAACCFLELDPSLFSISLFERNEEDCYEFGVRIAEWGKNEFQDPAFIITVSGLTNDGDALIRGIRAASPPGTGIYGGLAGDDSQFKDTFVFSHTGFSTNGAAVLVFDRSRVKIDGLVTSGWTGVGAEMEVTSSDGNVVYTINNRPATEVVREYLGVQEENFVEVAVTFPLLLKRPDGTEVLRAALSADFSAGSITYAGTVPQGTRVRFSSSFGYETIESSIKDIKNFHSHHTLADIVLAFSCVARHYAAGSLVNDEIQAALDLWNHPLIGFFTYGEIGHNIHGVCDFYNESLSLVLIRFTSGKP